MTEHKLSIILYASSRSSLDEELDCSIFSALAIFLANSLTTYLKTLSTNSSTLASAALAMQMTTGLAMMVLPTSYILIAGLSYFEIDYSKWLKFIAKIFLVLILVTGIIVTI